MDQLNTGIYGAKRQSFHRSSPRAVLLDVVEKYPREGDEKLFDIVLEILSDDPELIKAVAKYWFGNELKSLRRKPGSATPPTTVVQKTTEDIIIAAVETKVEQRVQIVLSNLLMPSGLVLRDADKGDCQRAGGWFLKIADNLGEGQRVRDVFNETQLRTIYLSAPSK